MGVSFSLKSCRPAKARVRRLPSRCVFVHLIEQELVCISMYEFGYHFCPEGRWLGAGRSKGKPYPVQASGQTGAGDSPSAKERYPDRHAQEHREASGPEIEIAKLGQ